MAARRRCRVVLNVVAWCERAKRDAAKAWALGNIAAIWRDIDSGSMGVSAHSRMAQTGDVAYNVVMRTVSVTGERFGENSRGVSARLIKSGRKTGRTGRKEEERKLMVAVSGCGRQNEQENRFGWAEGRTPL